MPQGKLVSHNSIWSRTCNRGQRQGGRYSFSSCDVGCCISSGVFSIDHIAGIQFKIKLCLYPQHIMRRQLSEPHLFDNFTFTILFLFVCKTFLGCFGGTKFDSFSCNLYLFFSSFQINKFPLSNNVYLECRNICLFQVGEINCIQNSSPRQSS